MNRLTEREPNWIDDELYMSACEPSDETVDEIYRRLKYYEDAEQQGRLVVLPCKVGEAVRAIVNRPFNGNNLTIFGEVSDIQTVVRVVHSGCRYVNFLISDFGKTVFLTEEEALKKMKDE